MKIEELKVGDILYYRYGDNCTVFEFFVIKKIKPFNSQPQLIIKSLNIEESFFDDEQTWGIVIPTDEVDIDLNFRVRLKDDNIVMYHYINDEIGLVKHYLKKYDDKPKFFNKVKLYTHKKHYVKYDSITERNMDSRGIL